MVAGSQTDTVAPPKEVSVKIFRSFHYGAGDADEVHFNHRMEDYAAIDSVTTRYNRVHGSMDPRRPGQMRMGFYAKRMAQTNHDLTPVFGIEWTDTNGIYPAIFYLVGQKIMKIRFGAVTEVGSNALGSNATGGMFDDDGSGVPYLYACFSGAAAGAKIRRMNRAQTVTTSADVVAGLLLSLNGKAYRTIIPTGGTATCQVSVAPYGVDRFTAANWGGGTTVGFAGTDINVLTACRQAPVAIKPEGIFAYNAGLDQWVNYTPSWRHFMHLNNGKGSFFIGDSLLVPMGDGGAVIFDGNNVRPFDPGGLDGTPNLHTTKTRFSSMAALRHWVVGVTPSLAKQISAGNSLRFFQTVDDVSFTDDSAAVRNLDLTDGSTLPANAALKIYIGWSRPFSGFHFDTGNANLVARTMTVKVGTGSGTWSSALDVVDFTSLAGATLGQSGNVVFAEDPVQQKTWIPTTVNGVSAYWVQLTFSGALTASVTWLNCLIQPWYPSLDTTNFPNDGIDKSGCLPHILFGRGDQASSAGTAIWHDLVSLSRPDDIGVIVFGDAGGSAVNRSRHMLAIGRFNVWEILTADDDMPSREPAPVLNDKGLLEGPSFIPAPGYLVRLREIDIQGYGWDPAWKCRFYFSMDDGKGWAISPTEINVPAVQKYYVSSAKGYRFRWAVGFFGTAGEALSQPTITEINATFEIVGSTDVDDTQNRPVATRPRI